MSLRVISGIAKGRKLKSVQGDTTRPITDRVKEALFNIIGADVIDSAWWDVFGGTGAVGIEALSRGAVFARFTDLNRAPIETIKDNLKSTHLESRAEAKRGDAFSLLAARPDKQFHYIYIAPPQYQEMWVNAIKELDSNPGWLIEDGWAIVQIDPKEYISPELSALEEFDQRRYGTTLLVFFQRKDT
ncbi:MAG TPA: 16S rRNA (guanine(966)-N(2))-methyltransferase RsmD [Anaerolineales bacterium]|jgi:16S rRNA (guanine(966)-N(2))-methyltransferase RsmD|nr:16S rRNA (guanine(966)-N(2))-methyltransferase RsmD [Anaerolineales bacterium]